MDTIFALATAAGKSGVAVVRISGPGALGAAEALAGPLPEHGRKLARLTGADGLIDEALVLTFAAGRSFTGEAVAELQCHGSRAVVAAVLDALAGQGLRPAEAGEFTRRALENGRLDLAQVEGLADLVEAETEAQRRQAVRVLAGALGAKAAGWRETLVRAAALIEATIDFADEEVPVDVTPEVTELIGRVLPELRAEVTGYGAAERLREGFEVAIVGRPNAGKSTLLNAMAQREAAITSRVAGTTRDVIEVRMDIAGLPVTLLDTAGLREAEDEVERIGVERAMSRAASADLRLFLLDADGEVPLLAPGPEDLVVRGKADLGGEGVSGLTGQGVSALIGEIGALLQGRVTGAATIHRQRQLRAVQAAVGALESAEDEVRAGSDRAELAAERLREAMRALDMLIGRVGVENLLDEIFSSFCIGK
ncbi:tRNA uridine-5-carboxymethylaminomethyl(34) synthesis GTPase MnmE [Pseudoroseicyclus tamaricis]|uniref:tRNA modification GTPase MnmE n=1 Tax=Pseudoroseicyclus tamaricis TaxID=2705421 RepID=A0A6B2K746_9RHOB|nr:tRNA uridine-5-carboxymethylaminomethyl(34) synthesis GTPase MnmE [Pseudoroseicyclus tamaricis]NDV02776.1 tRNA uridine-5-carboxymethylaminomethyl(34) synthesis GTPase MnmE [Pseudoroseicyclus tamaricis]